jgi:hypothetical protein
VFVADGAEDEAELEFPVEVEELADPTSSVCVAEEVNEVPKPVEVKSDKIDEFDAVVEEKLEYVLVDA